jgi:peptide/nickel transport system substrate-binding protein
MRGTTVRAGFCRVFIVLTLAMVACTPAAPAAPQQDKQASGKPQPEKHLQVIAGTGPTSLDPHLSISGQALTLFNASFNALTRFDENMRPAPALATGWKPLNDTTWEFKLRQGVKFHNGEDFDAEAVKFSLERILDPQLKAAVLSRMPPLAGVEVVDKYTVNISTKGPFPVLPVGLVWGWMLPPKYVQEMGNEAFGQTPIGTGPFKLQDWSQGQHANYTVNADYWDGKPKLDRLSIRFIPDPAVQVSSLKAGEAHLVADVPGELTEDIKSSPDLKIVDKLIGSIMEINLYSKGDGPLSDKRVRQALNYAVDKDLIVKQLLGGYGKVADAQVVSPEAFGYNPNVKAYPYDPDKAKTLLAEAGYPNGFEMPITTSFGNQPGDKEVSIALVSQLQKVGVTVNINNLEYGVYAQLRGKEQTPNFLTVWLNYGDARFALQHATTHKTTFPYWSNAEFDRLFDQSEVTLDPKAREKLLQDATALMADEAPCIFLHQLAIIYGVSNKVEGWQPHFSGWLFFDKADLKS